jgi:hypothetical protein
MKRVIISELDTWNKVREIRNVTVGGEGQIESNNDHALSFMHFSWNFHRQDETYLRMRSPHASVLHRQQY